MILHPFYDMMRAVSLATHLLPHLPEGISETGVRTARQCCLPATRHEDAGRERIWLLAYAFLQQEIVMKFESNLILHQMIS